ARELLWAPHPARRETASPTRPPNQRSRDRRCNSATRSALSRGERIFRKWWPVCTQFKVFGAVVRWRRWTVPGGSHRVLVARFGTQAVYETLLMPNVWPYRLLFLPRLRALTELPLVRARANHNQRPPTQSRARTEVRPCPR